MLFWRYAYNKNQGVDLKFFISIIIIFFSSYGFASNEGIKLGSGKFTIEGGKGHAEKKIDVYYHLSLKSWTAFFQKSNRASI